MPNGFPGLAHWKPKNWCGHLQYVNGGAAGAGSVSHTYPDGGCGQPTQRCVPGAHLGRASVLLSHSFMDVERSRAFLLGRRALVRVLALGWRPLQWRGGGCLSLSPSLSPNLEPGVGVEVGLWSWLRKGMWLRLRLRVRIPLQHLALAFRIASRPGTCWPFRYYHVPSDWLKPTGNTLLITEHPASWNGDSCVSGYVQRYYAFSSTPLCNTSTLARNSNVLFCLFLSETLHTPSQSILAWERGGRTVCRVLPHARTIKGWVWEWDSEQKIRLPFQYSNDDAVLCATGQVGAQRRRLPIRQRRCQRQRRPSRVAQLGSLSFCRLDLVGVASLEQGICF